MGLEFEFVPQKYRDLAFLVSVVREKSVGRVYKSNIVAIVISFAFVPSFFGIYGSNIRAPLLPPTQLKHNGVKLLLEENLCILVEWAQKFKFLYAYQIVT